MPTQIFVSSVQGEFAAERRAIKDFVHGDPLLSQHFRVFIFEDVPAQDRTPTDIYLNEVDRSAVYVGLFGSQYGFEDRDGISPTQHEFIRAVAKRLERLIFLRSPTAGEARHAKMTALVNMAQAQLTRRTFVAVADLCPQLYASLIRILERDGLIANRPFDARSARVPLSELEPRNVAEFTAKASTARNFSFRVEAGMRDTLAHLSLLDREDPSNAAVILFSHDPKRVVRGAFVNCMHFPGVEPVKPALSQNVFDGPLFRQIEESLSFVMSRLSSPVGTRDDSARLEVESELPKAAVTEAIVNALAHRDYASPAPVQVRLFADRLEVSNPGELPRSLTPEHLKRTHPSIPANPLLSEVLFLMGYIDRAGTGTLDMLAKCQDAGLPEPEFFQDGDHWVVRIWRDWLTDAFVAGLAINDRQRLALASLKANGHLDNRTYQALTGATDRTAARELKGLVDIGILVRVGAGGRGVAYTRAVAKPAKNPPNQPVRVAKETSQEPAKPAKAKKPKTHKKPKNPKKSNV